MQPLLRLLRRLDELVALFETGVVSLALLAMTALFFAYVVMRNVGMGSFVGLQVATQHLVLWVAMLGASLAVRSRRHIAVEVIGKAAPPQGLRAAEVLVAASTSLLCFLLAAIALSYVRFERTELLRAPNPLPLFELAGVRVWGWWSLLSLPMGFSVMGLRYALATCEGIFLAEGDLARVRAPSRDASGEGEPTEGDAPWDEESPSGARPEVAP